MGKEGQKVPLMTDEWVETISKKYIELFEKVTGQEFHPEPLQDEELQARTVRFLESIRR